jgi:hypothetical protein
LRVHNISAESPTVEIFPECRTLPDHKIFFTVNGFISNGNVHWEFINSKENIHSYGYFETDELGNFVEFIISDEIEPDTCTLRFF